MSNTEVEDKQRTLTKQVGLPADDSSIYDAAEEKKENKITQSRAENRGNDNTGEQKILYGIEDVPAWYMCILLGFQV